MPYKEMQQTIEKTMFDGLGNGILIEDLVEDLSAEFGDSNESDYEFFQELISYLIKRLENTVVMSNKVVFFGAYSIAKFAGRSIKFHFTNGKFTHLTATKPGFLQTFNAKSFNRGL